jgi:hypothetical protein
VEFIFCDFNMNRDYRLIHSNLRGEIQNDDWPELIRRGF